MMSVLLNRSIQRLAPIACLVVVALLFNRCRYQEETPFDPLSYVDPFIGTGAHGHTFPGSVVPYGSVQLSPDTHLMGWEASSGYHYDDSLIYGFSHTHLSGTGIGDLGDVLILPYTGAAHDSLAARFDKENEVASPGYYRVSFENYPVKAELTATARVGVHRYTFNGNDRQVMIDLGHVLQANWGHRSTGGTLQILDNKTIHGEKLSTGWAYDHRVFFHIEFSHPFEVIKVTNGKEQLDGAMSNGTNIIAFLKFDTTDPIIIKTGISSVDKEGAKRNLYEEMPHWDFEKVKKEAEWLWRQELGKIKVFTDDTNKLVNFYTAMYHAMIAPMIHQDVDGRYRGMDKQIHEAKPGFVNYTVFSLWDTFRSWGPLMTIIDSERMADWLGSLLQKAREGGVLPKWPLASNYTGTMVGYPAAALIADAIEKEIGSFDRQEALDALIFASQYHPDFKLVEPRGSGVMPKHLHFIAELGYVPADSLSGSVSYGLECAYYDWCISRVAKSSGRDSIADLYSLRSLNYRNYFNPASGFMEGKLSGERWKDDFSPFQSDFNGDFIEGNSWQWTWFVPHDVAGFIDLFGSPQNVESRLDSLFLASQVMEGEHIPGDLTGLIGQYAHGNEPSHHVTYLYNYLGKPEKTSEKVNHVLNELYSPTPDGISGNEDCGQMSAWYILSSLGIYQVCPGDPTFTLTPPLFDKASIYLENGKTFSITAENRSDIKPNHTRITLNGEELATPFITYREIMKGGVLKFEHEPK